MPRVSNNLFILSTCALLPIAYTGLIGGDQSEDDQPPSDSEDTNFGLHDPVLRLNRYTFQNTILQEHADEIPHWIVLFCAPWFEPCQAADPLFRSFANKWQDQLNTGLLSTEVRFAAIDCATEKALCNTQNIDTYPMISHYRHRDQVKLWRGKSFETDEKRLRNWLQKELGASAAAMVTQPESEDVTQESVIPNVPVDFLLIFAAIAGNAWFISRAGFGGGEALTQTASPAKSAPEGLATVFSPSVEQQTACVARSLPKEWGRDRPSLEL